MIFFIYIAERNAVNKQIRKAVKDLEKDIASLAKKDPKSFFKYANSKLKTKSGMGDLITENGIVMSDDKEKAQELNNFFSSVFTQEDTVNMPQDMPVKTVKEKLANVVFNESDISKILRNLKPNKSPGPDKVHPRVLNECASELSIPLYILFRKSLDEGTLPQMWKDGHISAIFKKGSRCQVNNYRPISLTSVVCKVLEKLVRNSLMQHLMDNQLISDAQHGFMPGRSCTTQLLQVLDKWTEILDTGGEVDVIYLDYAKAFDSVPHQRLILKLQSYGVSDNVLMWIKSFLQTRRQRVVVAGSESDWAPVLSGIPQGTILGPVLFLCFINEMPQCLKSKVFLYADDSKISRRIADISDCQIMQEDIEAALVYSNTWQLRFNTEKCKAMHIGHHAQSNKFEYSIKADGESKILEETTLEKDLGVWIDNDLKFSSHVEQAVKKANQMLGIIKRSFEYIDCDVLKQLYVAIVRPHLEYGNVVWHPRFKRQVQMLENVQHRATRLVPA